ncbi:MAG: hypothetical protein NT145_08990 [Elusimicrobia bacterium]|nr:hypothetical protein [Elusimicrobiota bacterium]
MKKFIYLNPKNCLIILFLFLSLLSYAENKKIKNIEYFDVNNVLIGFYNVSHGKATVYLDLKNLCKTKHVNEKEIDSIFKLSFSSDITKTEDISVNPVRDLPRWQAGNGRFANKDGGITPPSETSDLYPRHEFGAFSNGVNVSTGAARVLTKKLNIKMGETYTIFVGSKRLLAKSNNFEITSGIHNQERLLELVLKTKNAYGLKEFKYPCLAVRGNFTKIIKSYLFTPVNFKNKNRLAQIEKFISDNEAVQIKNLEKLKLKSFSPKDRNYYLKQSYELFEDQILKGNTKAKIDFLSNARQKKYLLITYSKDYKDGSDYGFSGLLKYYPKTQNIELLMPVLFSNNHPYYGWWKEEMAFIMEIDLENDGIPEYLIPSVLYEGIEILLIKKDKNSNKYKYFAGTSYRGL